MTRRKFILAASLLPFVHLLQADEFSEYLQAQTSGAKALQSGFEDYKLAYLKEYAAYKQKIEKEWDESKTTSATQWVNYSANMKSRTTIDYKKNTVQVSIRQSGDDSPETIKKLIHEAISKPASVAIKEDPVISTLHKDKSFSLGSVIMSGVTMAKAAVDKLIDNARLLEDQDSKGGYVNVTVTLPESAKSDRVRQFLPVVGKYAKEFKISPALVLAIMHTESAFNPLAQSHVPAFGLMQIVPSSAGLDVQRLIYKRNQAPSSTMLFKPDLNIQHGCAYLHILKYRYLKGIKDQASLEHCCIAAYNTGAGNVAKAFTGKTNVSKALKIINKLTPNEVYMNLRKKLTHKEARDYVLRVNKHKAIYTV